MERVSEGLWQTAHCLVRGSARWSWCARHAARTPLRVRAPAAVPRVQAPARALPEQAPAPARAPRAQAPPLRAAERRLRPGARLPLAAPAGQVRAKAVARRPRSTASRSTRWNATVTPKTAIWRLSRASESAVRRRTLLPAGPAPIAAPAMLIARVLRRALKQKPAVSRSRPQATACSCAKTRTKPSPAPTAWPATCRRSHPSVIASGNERVSAARHRGRARRRSRFTGREAGLRGAESSVAS